MPGQKRLWTIRELLEQRDSASLHRELLGLQALLKRADAENLSGFERRQARRLIRQVRRELERRETGARPQSDKASASSGGQTDND